MEKQIDLMIGFLKNNTEQYHNAVKKQVQFWNEESIDVPPLLLHRKDQPDLGFTPKSFDYYEIQFDDQKMLYSGLTSALMSTGDSVPSVRANKGCGIYPNMLGVKSTYFTDKMPWVQEHLTKEQISAMEPDQIKFGDQFKKGLETMSYLADRLKDTGCLVYPLDLQGVVDTAHLVYGDTYFYDLYDDPPFIHHLMNCTVEAMIKGCDAVLRLMDETGNTKLDHMTFIPHYNDLVIPKSKGGIKFSEDTTTLLNPDQIDEFALPYLQQLADYYGGGYVHFCGTNQHLYKRVMQMSSIYGINLGNPEKHDMEKVLSDCADTGKVYYGDLSHAVSGRDLNDYFTKCLKASYNGHSFKLLLAHTCFSHEIPLLKQTWKKAANAILEKQTLYRDL